MFSLNKHILIGRVGKEIKRRETAEGNYFVTFSLATSTGWRDKATGEWHGRTEWHNITVFNKALAKFALDYLRSGSLVSIIGEATTTTYVVDGVKHNSHNVVVDNFTGEMVFLEKKPDAEQQSYNEHAHYGVPTQPETTYGPKKNPFTPIKTAPTTQHQTTQVKEPTVKSEQPAVEHREKVDEDIFDDIPF